jgi:hypothetical protein
MGKRKERDASTLWIRYAALDLEARLVDIGVGTLVFCCLFAFKLSLPREKGRCKDHSLAWSAERRNINAPPLMICAAVM